MTQHDFAVRWRGLQLAGTLHLPVGEGPHPTLIMMQGSGPAERDADGLFVPIRRAFLERGIAAAAFDKPGCGESTGDWHHFGLRDRADQVGAVLEALGRRPDVDRDQIGLWGQSQGGWLAQLMAGERDDLAFAIANSGPSLSIPDQDRHGCEHRMRRQGAAEPDIEQALDFVSAIHAAARRGTGYEELERTTLRTARAASWYGYLTIDDERDWASTMAFVNERFSPVESLRHVACPFLAIFGGLDDLLPSWQCARDVGEALGVSACRDATVVVFPDGDHRIRVDGELVAGYLDLLGSWAAARVRRAG